MKKTFLLAGVAASLFAFNANAFDFQQYISGKLTYSDMSNDVKIKDFDGGSDKTNVDDKVWGSNFAYGIKNNALRTELELNINDKAKKSQFHDGTNEKRELENNSIMLNAYYDINTGTKFTPYIGVGIGMARLKATYSDNTGANISKHKNNVVWQLGAGISYTLTDNTALDLGYRYTDSGDVTLHDQEGNKAKFDSQAHEILLGIRYTF